MRFVYLYASPILRRDDRGEAVPMDLLNVTEEKAKLMQCFRDSAQDVSWSESVATRSTFLEVPAPCPRLLLVVPLTLPYCGADDRGPRGLPAAALHGPRHSGWLPVL